MIVKRERQVETSANRHVELLDGVDMAVDRVKVGFDMRPSHTESCCGDSFVIILVIIVDKLDNVVKILLRQRGHLTAVKRNIKRHHISLSKFVDGKLQGFQWLVLLHTVFGIVFEITIPASHIASQCGNV